MGDIGASFEGAHVFCVRDWAETFCLLQDDDDLDEMLRHREREDDPMLAYMKKKKSKSSTNKTKGLFSFVVIALISIPKTSIH